MIGFAFTVLKYWKFALIAGLVAYIGWQQLQLGHLEVKVANLNATLAEQRAEVTKAEHAVRVARDAADISKRSFDQAEADMRDAVAAMAREIERVKSAKQQVQIERRIIRERVEFCPPGPVPPGINSALDGLRAGPEAGAGGSDSVRVPAPGNP